MATDAPEPTRAPRRPTGRVWWAACYVGLVLLAVVFVVGPGALSWDDSFIAWSRPTPPTAVEPGDHLQISYYLWLWEHALTTLSHLPWLDPFQFAAGADPTPQPFGWPLVLLSLPVGMLFGPVAAYNTLVVVAFVASAVALYLLARELGALRAGAAVAGFAFAFAPFRLVQAATHFNALLAPLLPVTLLFVERATKRSGREARRAAWLAVASHLSVMASGELHLAVFASGLVAAWVALRARRLTAELRRTLLAPAVALVAGTALIAAVVYLSVLRPSVAGGGRSEAETKVFTPRVADLVDRGVEWETFERYAYPGAVITLAAVAGGVSLVRRRRDVALATALGAGGVLVTVVSLVPALDGLPALQDAYRAVPFLGFSRVPGRILVLSAVALAVLAAFAVDGVRRPEWRFPVALVLMVAIAVDAPGGLFAPNAAGPTAEDGAEHGANVLSLPPFDHGDYGGSVLTFLLTRAPGPRVGGYSPFVDEEARASLDAVQKLAAVPIEPCEWRHEAHRLDLDLVAVHVDLFGEEPVQWDADGRALVAALAATAGFRQIAEEEGSVLFAVEPELIPCVPPAGDGAEPPPPPATGTS